MIDTGAQAFREEAFELLEELESALLELEKDPGDSDHVAKAFRALHTIKGSGLMFGFEDVGNFAHKAESLLDKVRSGEIPVSEELLTLILQSKDHLHALILSDDPSSLAAKSDELGEQLNAMGGKTQPEASPKEQEADGEACVACRQADGKDGASPELCNTYWIRYIPGPRTGAAGEVKPETLLDEMASMGRLTTHKQPPQENLPSGRYECLLCSQVSADAVRDVFFFAEGDDMVVIHRVGDCTLRDKDYEALLELAASGPVEDHEAMSKQMQQQVQEWVNGRHEPTRPASDKHAAPDDEHGAADHPARPTTAQAPSSIRVDSSRLDDLVNMVGELVIIQSRLTQAVSRGGDPVLGQIAEDLERLTDAMRDNALAIRMMPIGATFGTFRRLVRDLSTSLDKEVDFVTIGEDTELDKTVIDRLKDPLVHILRNSIDHGLESPEERKAAGKPARGTVELAAAHSGGEVLITVSDDGRGVDPAKIKEKAVQRGLISQDADLPDKEIYNLLFEPGFSTAEKVSNVSGRGVGMDVVKRSIEALRGAVEMDSTPGYGLRLTLRLPLTLAIIDGLSVRVGEESFILPLAHVEACQERFLNPEAVQELEVIERMDRLIPCISLRKMLNVPGGQPDYERIVIVSIEGTQAGLAVDTVVGRQQAVIKSLEGIEGGADWISGTTINGDGGISLILDVPQLIRYASREADRLEVMRA
ncbi:MAG: chemotaxis protein CheA [Desulfovibrionaceae bacterium]